MVEVVQILLEILRPLTNYTLVAALVGGLIFGRVYNKRLRIPNFVLYHQLIAVLVFLVSVGVVRVIATGSLAFAGYIGIGILWGLFLFFTFLGSKLP